MHNILDLLTNCFHDSPCLLRNNITLRNGDGSYTIVRTWDISPELIHAAKAGDPEANHLLQGIGASLHNIFQDAQGILTRKDNDRHIVLELGNTGKYRIIFQRTDFTITLIALNTTQDF